MERNDNQKAVIGVVECAVGWDKEPRQMYKGNSFFSNQAPFRSDKPIQNNDGIKLLRFAEQNDRNTKN